MANHKPIKCAACNVPLQGRGADLQPDDALSCPSCGQGDTYENVMREIKDYVTEKTAEHLSASMRKIASRSKFMTFRENHRPKKRHRFVVDINL